MKGRGERGSILLETVVAIPLLVLAAMVIVQGLVLASGLGAVSVAAKDAARAAADSCATISTWQAAHRPLPDFVTLRDVQTSRHGDNLTAQVRVELQFRLGSMSLPGFEVVREAQMPRLESCR